jgi:deoxycytidine triphosphate deaminase
MLRAEKIFKDKTWDEKNVRGAAYDLRVADDFLVVPSKDGPNGKGYRKYKKGEKRDTFIVLEPGDVAFISSYEKIHMPWTLAGNIGIKFGLARNGVLILTGLIVDPGYGMEE